jgi:uroporphyrinogen decarboxylase
MDKRERLEKTLAGEAADRVPVALWRYWPGDDLRAADLARSTLDFQQAYDWDFVKLTPFSAYCVADYGLQTEWQGDPSGDRGCIKHLVRRSLDWTELRTLDPTRGELGKHLAAINIIGDALKADGVPIIATIYSPLTQAAMLAEGDLMIQNMRTHPDRLRTGLNIITESTLRFIDVLGRTEVAGVFYVAAHASYGLMPEDEYRSFAASFDLRILENLPARWWLNVLSLPGSAPMFELAAGYPVRVLHWDAIEGRPDLDRARMLFQGVLCGGLCARQHLLYGTPAMVRDAARDALIRTDSRRFILSAGDAVPVTAPLSNLRAVREAVAIAGIA